MQTHRSTTSAKPDRGAPLKWEHLCDLLDVLTSVRRDLQKGVRERAAYPEQLAPHISRVVDDIDASTGNITAIIRERRLRR